MKAKKKPLDRYTPEELGVDVSPRLKLLKATEPPSDPIPVVSQAARATSANNSVTVLASRQRR